MTLCEGCGKKVYGGKHREVALDGDRVLLCGECGKIEFTTAEGQRGGGLLMAVNQPRRRTQKGRDITFHAEAALKGGDRIQETSFVNLPQGKKWPARYRVLAVRPLVVTEAVVPAEGEKEGKRPRRRKRRVGYTVRACSC